MKNIIETILCTLSGCVGAFTGLLSPFIFAYFVDNYLGHSVVREYSFNLDTIDYKSNPILSPYVYINSKKGFSDLLFVVGFDTGNIVSTDPKKDINMLYSISIKDYETKQIIYEFQDIYLEIHLPGSKYSNISKNIYFNNLSLKDKKYIFEMKYYQVGNSATVYHYNAVMKPYDCNIEYKLFDTLMSV